MNTLNMNESYKMINSYLKGGEKIFNEKYYDNIIKSYLEYLKSTDILDETISRKSGIVYTFLSYLKLNNLKLNKVNFKIIYDFINLISEFQWKITYLDRCKFDLKKFLNWLFENKLLTFSGDIIIPKINWHKRSTIKSFYTKEEIEKMLDVIDISTNQGKEDFLILSIISYYGLRISDVLNLKISNFDFDKNLISIIQFKTKEPLILALIDEVKYPLLDYLKNVRPQTKEVDYVFVSFDNPSKKKNYFKNKGRIVGKYLTKAGVDITNKKHGFHSIRFSLSTILLNENIDLYTISKILGHTDIKTTMNYLDIDISKLKELSLEVPLC